MGTFCMVLLIICIFGAIIATINGKNSKIKHQGKYNLPKEDKNLETVHIIDIEYNGICVNNNIEFIEYSYIWKDEYNIYIVPNEIAQKNFDKIQIPINRIIYFTRIGDCYTSTHGGGSRLGGAVAGAVIAGETGAMIGSRKKVETKLVDKRITILKVLDKNEKIIKFKSEDYDAFLKLIPEKEKDLQCRDGINIENNIDINIQAIHKLDELRKEGILSEEEFSLKKKQILEKIH
ncbi:TPA: SHOCT domain-containing protein [Clostridium botulinum]|nr:SHOCT domain-containing protein [Clostridium botulinum]